MRGKRWRMNSASREVRSSQTCGEPVRRISVTMDARNHVARREIDHRVIALHERFARVVAQHRAFAAQRFRKQKARRAFDMQRGGMKLHELDIVDLGARAPRHGDAVARGDIGIGGFLEHASQSAGGEQHGARADVAQGAGFSRRRPPRRRPRPALSRSIRRSVMAE